MNEKGNTLVINGTEYIPVKEAEIGFLIGLIGIVSGIIFGFFVLKLNYGTQTQATPLTESKPLLIEKTNEAVPVDGPDAPLYDFGDEEETQGQKDITV